MATDVPNQQFPVIAKDLLIAALATEDVQLDSDVVKAAAELGQAFKTILKALHARDD